MRRKAFTATFSSHHRPVSRNANATRHWKKYSALTRTTKPSDEIVVIHDHNFVVNVSERGFYKHVEMNWRARCKHRNTESRNNICKKTHLQKRQRSGVSKHDLITNRKSPWEWKVGPDPQWCWRQKQQLRRVFLWWPVCCSQVETPRSPLASRSLVVSTAAPFFLVVEPGSQAPIPHHPPHTGLRNSIQLSLSLSRFVSHHLACYPASISNTNATGLHVHLSSVQFCSPSFCGSRSRGCLTSLSWLGDVYEARGSYWCLV